jgi:hypothetical protein
MARGKPTPLGPISTDAVVKRIWRRHEKVDDPHLGRFPDSSELLAVVRWVASSTVLRGQDRRDDCYDAAQLVRYVEEKTLPRLKLAVIRSGRQQRWTWEAVGRAFGQDSRTGAETLATRLEAVVGGEPEGHTPEPVRADRIGQRARQAAAVKHAARLLQTAHDLLQHRERVLTNAEVEEWLDDLAELLEEGPPAGAPGAWYASVAEHVSQIVSGIVAEWQATGQDPATTPPAHDALNRAASVVDEVSKQVRADTAGSSAHDSPQDGGSGVVAAGGAV